MPSEQSLQKLREICRNDFGVDISLEEAAEVATLFLNSARVICQPMPKKFENRYKELLNEQLSYEQGG